MLKKQNRLGKITKAKENKLFTSPFFNVRISDSKEDKTRFAFIVSKKIDKRAVIRNQTKRVLRNAAAEAIKKLDLRKDIIIVSKKVLKHEQQEEVSSTLNEIFKKAGIVNV
jgi:ribonuclease P protein component